ncbi:adenine-specific DNA-methyltransferase [Gemmobacter aquatilis]|uniref:site-specific DNA-methyltransferase (adenine-specific) n=1 Tax=Gemmobacter aquatilis TaxID=933059 RepID=A0A1H7Z5V1_9RHOB|nr:site-specific DNA-methyltransferase [Gemmobacter aquatilis]SEM53820.1 adenine-specific DNA-methyltransferase [Gemmobacter aquatilis]
MTELVFKGKEFVWNHHLAVPFRPLVVQADKGIGEPRLDGNLIIQGDNLHALKALLPMYSGKVDCIFIDPPYNTGEEDWSYNDNVNAPMIKEWLNSNPIGIEDGLRHDKWCAMMWPRLRLLHELLSDDGSIWITLDDNEVHRARAILDEIFGEDCSIGQIVWQKRTSRENRAVFSPSFDHVLVYSKALKDTWKLRRNRLLPKEGGYANPDNDPRGPWASIPFSAQGFRENQVYTIVTPTGVEHRPPKGRCWGATEPEFEKYKERNLVYWPKGGNGKPRIKQFPEEAKGLVPMTLWPAAEVGTTEDSKKVLMDIFSDYQEDQLRFHAPKPVDLVRRVIEIATRKNSVVLDSFSGTGTTGHAVIAANKWDGGNRRFILCEMEDYADRLTAERVRRVINGYAFTGTQKTELAREKLNWRTIEKAADLVHKVQAIENLHGHEYDRIKKEVKDGELVVTGEKAVAERAEGLGGTFTYCTLGDPVELDRILTGVDLPAFEALGPVLYHMATAEVADPAVLYAADFYLGEASAYIVWMIYKPDLDWLKTSDAALTLSFARHIHGLRPDKKHLVFAPARHVSQRMLDSEGLGVEFAPLPQSLYRVERG